MTQTVLEKLHLVAAKRFGETAKTLAAEADFYEALGIDSLQALDLLTELEEAFDVEVPDYELQGVTTFAALAEVVESRL